MVPSPVLPWKEERAREAIPENRKAKAARYAAGDLKVAATLCNVF
jgi:hypothetical protein